MEIEPMKIDEAKIAEHFTVILTEGLGLNLQDAHLKDTPKRIAKFYREFFEVKDHKLTDFEETNYNGMVIIRSTGYSLCSHHFLPYSYDCYVGYIPKGKIIGASKIPRIIDSFAKKPTVQERLTQCIATFIFKELKVDGVAVVMYGKHLCMMIRGVQKTDSCMMTSSVMGSFEREDVKQEFFELLKVWRQHD